MKALVKYAIIALVAATFADLVRYRREQRARASRHEALQTWEGEGGAVPGVH
jgi:hypothetical protein